MPIGSRRAGGGTSVTRTGIGAQRAGRARPGTGDGAPAGRLAVVAIGGNALTTGKGGDMEDQWAAARASARDLAGLAAAGVDLLLVHGNGPQVGRVLRRAALGETAGEPPLSTDVAVAHTQGEIGYMLARALGDRLHAEGVERPVAALLTQVRVDPDDEAFGDPDKPIGAWMPEAQALRLARTRGWHVRHLPPKGWRRVVPSPQPRAVIELPIIRSLLDAGTWVVAGGGGGIPVTADDGRHRGIAAVVDKDRTAALLARALGAATFIIATDVTHVMADFGLPTEHPILELTVSEAERMADSGQFPGGSMGPKVASAMEFVASCGRPARIAHIHDLHAAWRGEAGTAIVPG